MSGISELVKKLRDKSSSPMFPSEFCKMLTQAADTIEELSAKLSALQMERSSQYYHGGWIPCEERLPEDSENVLTTFNTMINGGTHDGEYIKIVGIGCYSSFYRKWELHTSYSIYKDNVKVIAWRPLPEPYREVQDK